MGKSNNSRPWYEIDDIDELDSPALLLYEDRIASNIDKAIQMVGHLDRLRPHVKTHKSGFVARMMMERGIHRFKCATIAEAEMLAMNGAKDVMLAHQPYLPKIDRLIQLAITYHQTRFSTIVDNEETAKHIGSAWSKMGKSSFPVYIDLDVGMNRTGINPEKALDLALNCQEINGIELVGLHVYDGHLRHPDISARNKACDQCFDLVKRLSAQLESQMGKKLSVVAGGSPTFPIHANRSDVECSPGTFIFWDWGYNRILKEQPFEFAALVLTRVLSKVSHDRICLDLGHKSIASENPFPRVQLLNAPEATQVGHSEEHLVLDVGDNSTFKVGEVYYGVPIHVCPTVALYDYGHLISQHRIKERIKITARRRMITI